MEKRALIARVPVALTYPDEMSGSTKEVLSGEYETGYFGDNLVILDIGANVGSFSIWAHMRWPHSVIHAYEPHPQTFEILVRNVAALSNVHCHNAAIYPGADRNQLFYGRYVGDGEAGLLVVLRDTFANLPADGAVMVSVVDPRDLPRCDVMKLDVEGAEARILEAADVSHVSTIVLEYQNAENRLAIERLLGGDFILEHEDRHPWTPLLTDRSYRQDLRGNHFGHLTFANRRHNRLEKIAPKDLRPEQLSPRQLLALLPGALKTALGRKFKGRV
jgi:FkbM family methyltransferase